MEKLFQYYELGQIRALMGWVVLKTCAALFTFLDGQKDRQKRDECLCVKLKRLRERERERGSGWRELGT